MVDLIYWNTMGLSAGGYMMAEAVCNLEGYPSPYHARCEVYTSPQSNRPTSVLYRETPFAGVLAPRPSTGTV